MRETAIILDLYIEHALNLKFILLHNFVIIVPKKWDYTFHLYELFLDLRAVEV